MGFSLVPNSSPHSLLLQYCINLKVPTLVSVAPHYLLFKLHFYMSMVYACKFQQLSLTWGSSTLWQIGKSKVFLRAGQMAEIDARRNEVLGKSATIIQKQIRTYFFRRWFKQMRLSAIQIQTLCRGTAISA